MNMSVLLKHQACEQECYLGQLASCQVCFLTFFHLQCNWNVVVMKVLKGRLAGLHHGSFSGYFSCWFPLLFALCKILRS
jgi:hypothetical protein